MTEFIKRIHGNRRISVWGIGYLGYTWLLRLQSKGFVSDIYDASSDRIEALMSGAYPTKLQKDAWSSRGEMQSLDLSKITADDSLDHMFENNVHIISFPGKAESGSGNRLEDLSKHFLHHKEKVRDSLVIFQCAETPGDIERYFINELKKNEVECSFSTAFRTDWTIEEFLHSDKKRRVVAGYDSESLYKVKYFFKIFGIGCTALSSIKEAEIYESSRKALQYTVSSFINQLALAYPETNIRQAGQYILNDSHFEDMRLSIGNVNYKAASAIRHLLDGSKYPSFLKQLHDAETSNIYSLINYSELICSQGVRSVTILGVSVQCDLKDIRLSPALVLAELLLKAGIEVAIHDPYFTADEITDFLEGVRYYDITKDPLQSECVILIADHQSYRFLTQNDLDRVGISSAKIIIDNAGLWEAFDFSKDSLYHIPGDGKYIRFRD
jgi:UDP-N-acetyl-D-mannosaminuronate dehydrogenase